VTAAEKVDRIGIKYGIALHGIITVCVFVFLRVRSYVQCVHSLGPRGSMNAYKLRPKCYWRPEMDVFEEKRRGSTLVVQSPVSISHQRLGAVTQSFFLIIN
jgi:hypothetical protein